MTGLWARWLNLGHMLADQAVGNILKCHDIPPVPERNRTTT